jgi:hypothetical protein
MNANMNILDLHLIIFTMWKQQGSTTTNQRQILGDSIAVFKMVLQTSCRNSQGVMKTQPNNPLAPRLYTIGLVESEKLIAAGEAGH